MSNGWSIKKLGELCEFENGDRGENYPSKSVQTTSGIPFINAGHLGEDGIDFQEMNYIPRDRFNLLGAGKVRRGDLLFCLRGSLGKVAPVNNLDEGAIASSLVIVRPSAELSPYYLLAYFRSNLCLEEIEQYRNGAAQPNLSSRSLSQFEIPVPPLPEQQRIVGILDEAFAGIATAKANAEKNLRNARDLFANELNSTHTGHEAHSWPERRLGDVFEIGSSKRIHERDWSPSGVPFYGGKEIVKLAMYGEAVSNAYISEKKYHEYAAKCDMPKLGDILITARGTIGVGYIVSGSNKFYYKDGNIISMRAKEPTNPRFLLNAFRSNALANQLDNLSGTTVRHLPLEKAKELRLRMPSFEVQNALIDKLELLEAETQRLASLYQQKLAALDALKKSLLHQAFSGQLAEKALSAV